MSAPTKPNEAIAVLVGPSLSHSIQEAEQCLYKALQETQPGTRIVTSDEFRRSVFSYRVPEGKAERTEYMQSLMNHPLLKERIAAMGIHLVFILDSETTQTSERRFVNPLPGGTFVMASGQDRTSTLRVTVFEFGRPGEAGEVGVSASGVTGFAGVAPFLVAGLAFTETRVCDELPAAVSRFLGGAEQQAGAASK